MRLIHAPSRTLKEFNGDDIPAYVILSHTWGADEVTLQDMAEESRRDGKAGYSKIELCCNQAIEDSYDYVWVDTCCIDKTSSAELSEAINSMYKWYRNSEFCYVYLSDMTAGATALEDCRYFSRGWTLQELIAPQYVDFFDKSWRKIGSKTQLAVKLSDITRIPKEILVFCDDHALSLCSVAEKFSWAADRMTSREEDRAYSLLGLLNVNMPLLYGEGSRAFERLQRKVIKSSSDPTIFAWTRDRFGGNAQNLCGLLADSPDDFRVLRDVVPDEPIGHLRSPPTVRSDSITITLPCQDLYSQRGHSERGSGSFLARLNCKSQGQSLYIRLCFVRSWDGGRLRRSEVISRDGVSNDMLHVQSELKEQSLIIFSDKVHVTHMPITLSFPPAVSNPDLFISLPLLEFATKAGLVDAEFGVRLRHWTTPGPNFTPLRPRHPGQLTYATFPFSLDAISPHAGFFTSGLGVTVLPFENEKIGSIILSPYYDSIWIDAGAQRALCVLEFHRRHSTIAEIVIVIRICRPRPQIHFVWTEAFSAPRREDSQTSRNFQCNSLEPFTSDHCEISVPDTELPLHLSANIRKCGGLRETYQSEIYKVEVSVDSGSERSLRRTSKPGEQ